MVEEYFENRKDHKCEVVNHGNNVNNVKLVVEMKGKRGWINFFFDPEENYGDFKGMRTLRHACKDLYNCDNTEY